MRAGGGDPGRSVDETTRRFEPATDGSPAVTVVRTVAAHRDVPPLDLPQFGRVVAADALSDFVSDAEVSGLRVAFTYADCEVVVRGDGLVTVRDTDPGPQNPAAGSS